MNADANAPAPRLGQRPSGTVTFAFTDIEGSTRRWEEHPAEMPAAVQRHDALMRAAIEARGGYVFKTVGDAFCACFTRPEDGIAAMIEAQRALAAEDFSAVRGIRIRAALHTGTCEERDGDYFGPTVNRVARLLSIGHGGQILVSGATADLVQGAMPPRTTLRDLGSHRLKDLARPEQVYQVVAPDLPDAFSALRSLDALPNNLPRRLTSFVGREAVIAEVRDLIESSPLVTLVGPGGAGKTRCAVQVGAELLDGSGDGVWFVELAPISDPALVATVVAEAVGLRETATRTALQSLIAFLKRKRLLLIVDNCEHVIDEARALASAILASCPEVRLLVTSREGLNIAGEEVYRMPSLAVPATNGVAAIDAMRYGAVALFRDRARSVEKRFELTNDNVPAVVEICRRLDGIPLAIELAAARVKTLAPQQLARRLDERFTVLTGGDRSALPRQQTMRALIDWSFDLLTEAERTLFRRLSIFAGGFTLDEATAVCTDQRVDAVAVFDLLTSLVDKSLVQADIVRVGTRYRLLESTREYAREKLVASGEYAALAYAHAKTYCALAEALERVWHTTPSPEWLARVDPERENFRAALEWALEARGDVALGRLLASFSVVTFVSSPAEGRRWVRAAQQTIDESTPDVVVARLDITEAFIDWRLALHKASFAAARRALERYRRFDDPYLTAWTLRIGGNAAVILGRGEEGEAMLQEALEISRRIGAQKLSGWVLEALGAARYLADDLDGARANFAEALAISTATGHWQLAATVSLGLAEAEFRAGDAAAALRLAGEAFGAYSAWNDAANVALTRSDIATYLIALGRYDEAFPHACDALEPLRDAQREVAFTFALQHLAAIAALRPSTAAASRREDMLRAARLLGYVDARTAQLEALREYAERQEYDRIVAALRAELGDALFARARTEGAAWSEDYAVAQALGEQRALSA